MTTSQRLNPKWVVASVDEAVSHTAGKSTGAAILTRNPSALVWAMY